MGTRLTASKSVLNIRPLSWIKCAPWIREGLIGSIRRECLDHAIVVKEHCLRGTLHEYVSNYNAQRTHLGIGKDSPEPREVQAEGEIDKVAVVGGLHHYYYRRAA